MKRDDWMLFILTFLTGAVLGMYVYFAVWKPVYAPDDLNSAEVGASDWSLVGERRYGDSIDASFRLLADGSYVFIVLDENGEPESRKQGNLSKSLITDLQVSASELASYEEEQECEDVGRAEYRYRFTVEEDIYSLDTCKTVLGQDSELATTLNKVWQKVGGEAEDNRTPAAMFTDWLNGRIGVNRK